MMPFAEMRDIQYSHFNEMIKDETHLFTVLVDNDYLYNHIYLDGFPEGTNLIYRKRREFDCSCCRGYIKQVGNVVKIKDGKIETIWDFETGDSTYDSVFKRMSAYVKSCRVNDVFLSINKKVGSHHNFEQIEAIGQKKWDHFFFELPDRFVIRDGRSKGDVLGSYRATRDVFKNSLDSISIEAVDAVLEMINDNTLYKGTEYKYGITEFRKYKVKYDSCENKELFAWEYSVKAGDVIARIKNHAIGTLLVNITEGMDLETAVKKYEVITAPANYKRPKPIFTKRMLEDAQKKITELGYMNALPRRFAKLDDITVNDILYCNRDASSRVSGAEDIFGVLAKSATNKAKKSKNVTEVSVDDFLKDILPTAKKVELSLENKHTSNMVSLIAPQNANAKSMFKWGNNFSWAYSGNLTDSSMKDLVKAKGGNVTGDLRCSLQWNECGTDNYDLDAHMIEPSGNEICFRNCRKPSISPIGGQLDVDIVQPGREIAVENISYVSRNKMINGTYTFFVEQYSGSVKNGFRAEIEVDGVIYSFDYPYSMKYKEIVSVAEIILKDGVFTVKPLISSSMSSKEVWNVKTQEFISVSVVCFSPNYWENNPVKTGHKHLLFMLEGCKNDESPSGMFNEFLVHELDAHRKVMEALGGKMRVNDSDDQLSGVGFALDKRNDVTVKVDDRVYKVIF